jgi:hypothetical protein
MIPFTYPVMVIEYGTETNVQPMMHEMRAKVASKIVSLFFFPSSLYLS